MGIDIQRDCVCALQLRRGRAGETLQASARLPLDIQATGSADEIESLASTLEKLKRKFAFRGRSAVVCLPPEYTVSFPVTFEIEPRQTLEEALIQACRTHLSFPVQEAVIDYLYVQAADTGSDRQRRACIVAVPQSRIARILQVFWQSGWRVDVIDFSLSALLRLHCQAHTLGERPTVIIHMGDEASLLAVASRQEIVAHRHLNWGVGRLLRRLAENMQIDARSQSPRNLLREYGLAYGAFSKDKPTGMAMAETGDPLENAAPRVVSQILAPYLEDLLHEVYQLIGYTRSLSPGIVFEEICLYGMAHEIRELETYFQQRLEIATRGVNPFEQLSVADASRSKKSDTMQAFVYAMGLALREAS